MITTTSSPGLSRRAILRGGALVLGGPLIERTLLAAEDRHPALRFGAVTDVHYADKESRGTRHYRESLGKLEAGIRHLDSGSPRFLVELGDLIDRTEKVEDEIAYLRRVDKVYATASCDRHYVFGNHCIDTLTKNEFLENSGAVAPHYSFDEDGFHFVILDSCYRSDGTPYGRKNADWKDCNLPKEQLEWLAEDLRRANHPTVVFAHQRLDGEGAHFVNNAAAARKVLADSGNVLAVFQGHSHRNEYQQVDGIHFCTLVAVVEGSGPDRNGASLISLFEDGSIQVTGFLRQQDHEFGPVAKGG